MTQKVELLAPAGSFESLIAAVQNGADAVYLGGTMFNARQNAANFDDIKLQQAVEYAHIRGAYVYLTLNTLLSDDELTSLPNYLINVYKTGVDGIIVQDLGVAKLVKTIIPDIKLHASTQMTIHNLEGVQELQKLGFERAVLARELTLNEIEYVCRNSSIDIEIFIHGALCISYSGQCLMSSLIGGRSGNRGLCAQPCRLPYSIEDSSSMTQIKHGHLLSPKDLCSLHSVGEIINAGVKSLKIEGRMKRPEYVATVIRIYRKYIDMYLSNDSLIIDKDDEMELAQIFNRGGFTKGYFYGKLGSSMMSYEKPSNWGVYLGTVENYNSPKREVQIKLHESLCVGDGIEFWTKNKFEGMSVSKIIKNNTIVKNANKNDTISLNVQTQVPSGTKVYKTSSIQLLDKAAKSYLGENKKIDITGIININNDLPLTLIISDCDSNTANVTSDIKIEKAINSPITEERVIRQLQKLGDTPYRFTNIECNIDPDISVPISEINNLRRSAIEQLTIIRKDKTKPVVNSNKILKNAEQILTSKNKDINQITKLSIYLNNVDLGIRITQKVDRIYIPITSIIRNKKAAIEFINNHRTDETDIFIAMPRILRKDLIGLITNTINELDGKFDGILLTGIGQKELFNKPYNFAVDFSFNIFNSMSANFVEEQGASCITLSPELKLSQAKNIVRNSAIETELIVYGRLPMMISEYCPTGSVIGKMCETKKCSVNCGKNHQLVDRMDNRLPIITDRITCQSQILNPKKLFLGDDIEKIRKMGPSYIRLDFTTEDYNEINDMIKFHREFLDMGTKILDNYKKHNINTQNDYTKGHYFRGVE